MRGVLIIEDDPEFSISLMRMLEVGGWQGVMASTREAALAAAAKRAFDAVLLDLGVARQSGADILAAFREKHPAWPVIVVASSASLEMVAAAMRLGAFEFLTRPFGSEVLVEVLRRAFRLPPVPGEQEKQETGATEIPSLVGRTPAMIELFKTIVRVARTDAPVLISGERGTGKEAVARAIHDYSARSTKPFVAVDCGAMPSNLLDSELFGHARQRGLLKSATGGTVFLNEINETSPVFQIKLLRTLQERKIRAIGTAEETPVDVRVVAATRRPLETLWESGHLRRELLQHIGAINMRLPPLRERREDIPLLAQHFLQRYNARERKAVSFPPQTMEWLQGLAWEGNVAELQSAVERAVAAGSRGDFLPQDFAYFGLLAGKTERGPDEESKTAAKTAPARAPLAAPVAIPFKPVSIDEMTREHIIQVLRYTKGNRSRAADMLGIGRYSLYRMANRLGIDLDRVLDPAVGSAMNWDTLSQTHVLDSIHDIIYERDLAGVLTNINAAGERFFGYPRSILTGATLGGLLNVPDFEARLRATNQKLLDEGVDRSELTVRDSTGRMRVLESEVSALRDAAGNPAGARGVLRDVTEARELARHLQSKTREHAEASENLRELNRIKSDVTGMLTEDLKTPLGTITALFELLKTHLGGQEPEPVGEWIKKGLATGKGLMKTVEDMAELFRYESEALELQREWTRVPDLIEKIYQEALPAAANCGVVLTRNIAATLPPVFFDPAKMWRAITNLVECSLHRTPAGGTVMLEAVLKENEEQSAPVVRISVLHEGQAIPPEELPYVFDPFWRGRGEEGHQLGLSLAKRLVSANGGSVEVVSHPDAGNEFRILLPARAELIASAGAGGFAESQE